ncbi:hypothetical protein SAMN05444722_3781 [Rhodovulum sp. ES.010]|uniref:O-antigen ligase family protein n=1 Tax=Rhodovulum sp. ES.010 TaxID=1882821 RepID=UPI00092A98E6|nr:hypothetical protein [Rhodovulum sp. ES.010]SIO59829.1 hypothetical protein SAMN05444722_3781 [Rhodovulum sp. ES.010]
MIPPLFVLALWPPVVAVLFARLKPAQAVVWSILAGYLLLPEKEGFNFPLFPLIDKHVIPSLAALTCAAAVAGTAMRDPRQGVRPGWLPRSPLALLCITGLVAGTLATVLTNGDALVYGGRVVVGLHPTKAPSMLVEAMLALIPFFLARRFLGRPEAHRFLLVALATAALGYSLLALYEVRMSPQLNVKIYGYFQHIWNQHVRGDGFRPLVFLEHGLWLSLFFSGAVLAALGLYRAGSGRGRFLWLAAAGWLFMTLVLSKSLGALAVTVVLAPVILFLGMRTQLLAASVIAAIVITYPMLRGAGLVPIGPVVSLAEQIDPGRAASLETRLQNEEALLAKANQRPVFGWGRWGGRNRVYDESGHDITVTDGHWVITIGASGWIGYLCKFGLLAGAIIVLWLRSRRYEIDPVTAALAVVLAGNLIDLLPNAGLTPLTWLMAGALYGRVEYGRIGKTAEAPAEAGRQGPRLSRFGPGTQPDAAPPALPQRAPGPVYARHRHGPRQRRVSHVK